MNQNELTTILTAILTANGQGSWENLNFFLPKLKNANRIEEYNP